jgi:uncharacterized protein
MKIKLNILGISYSQSQSGAYALILAEEGGNRRLPIIIGGNEAQSIAIQLEGLITPRPLTHDLFVSFASAFNVMVTEVVIYKLEEGIFYAELVCDNGVTKTHIDARTSDAVALALRFKCPVFTTDKIMSRAGIIVDDEENEDSGNSDKSKYDSFKTPELEDMLNNAVTNEDYEEASQLRDEIARRKQEEQEEEGVVE